MVSDALPEAEDEIAVILARLQEEVRGGAATADGARTGASWQDPLPARLDAQRAVSVTADRPFEYMPGVWGRLRGYLLVPVKLVLRKLMRWYVEPLAAHQRAYNTAVLRLIDQLTDRTAASVGELERRVEALEERLSPDSADRNR